MKIENVIVSTGKILIAPISDRWYEIPHDVEIWLSLKGEGSILVRLAAGFRFDGRSGGPLCDFIEPNLGTQGLLVCWLMHDVMGYAVCFDFDETNEMLRQMLILAGVSRFKASLVKMSVGLSSSWYGEPKFGDREYPNLEKISFRHYDKKQM